MIRTKCFTIYLALFYLLAIIHSDTQAQFIRLSMEVEPELKAATVRPLRFGTVEQNSGDISVTLDEKNTGVFAISGNPEQFILVNLIATDILYHADQSIPDNIPITIEAAYANRGEERIEDAQFFTENHAFFKMLDNTSAIGVTNMSEVTAYIYVFGSIHVSNVETGAYSGDVILQVEYL